MKRILALLVVVTTILVSTALDCGIAYLVGKCMNYTPNLKFFAIVIVIIRLGGAMVQLIVDKHKEE